MKNLHIIDMRKIFFAFVFLIFQHAFSTDIFNVQLNENEKLEETKSIVLNRVISIHFLFIKNNATKRHLIRPFFLTPNKKIIQLEDAVFETKINIISSHNNNNIITLGNYDKENETLHLIDFDIELNTNTTRSYVDYKEPKSIFELEGRTIYCQIEKNNPTIHLEIITNIKKINRKDFYLSKDILKNFKKIITPNDFQPLQTIKQNEFVKNGSISKRNVYIINDKLIFVSSLNSLKTDVFSFDLNDDKNISNTTFDLFFPASGQDQNTYLFDDKLAVISSSKQDLLFALYDLKTNLEVKQFSLIERLVGKIDVNLFLKEARKSKLKITMTFNKTKNNNYLVILDRVDKINYNYDYRPDIWIQRQMIDQQRMMMQSRHIGNGPNNNFFNNIYLEDKYESLTFYMDANFNIIDEDKSGTVFKYFDKDALLKTYDDNKNVNELSAAFLDNEFRFIYQNKDSKTISIGYETIQ